MLSTKLYKLPKSTATGVPSAQTGAGVVVVVAAVVVVVVPVVGTGTVVSVADN